MKEEIFYLPSLSPGYPYDKYSYDKDMRKIVDALRNRGYRTFSGRIKIEYDLYMRQHIIYCRMTTKDLLFKQFDWPWMPEWKRIKEIKRRSYESNNCR